MSNALVQKKFGYVFNAAVADVQTLIDEVSQRVPLAFRPVAALGKA